MSHELDSDDLLTARRLVISEQNASISLLQRHLRLGYRAAQELMQKLEASGVVCRPDQSGSRLLSPQYRQPPEERW